MQKRFPGTVGLLCLLVVRLALAEAPRQAAKIEVDTTEVPELADLAPKVQEVADKWYPIVVEMLPSKGFVASDHITIVFEDKKGVAWTSGSHITCTKGWFVKHPDDLGAVVHELTHVVQAYKKPGVPGWLIEGIADWVRWFNYEPENHRPHPKADRARYDASYQTTAAFLDWAAKKYDKKLVIKLNAACREGHYSAELWKDLTGETVEELGHEWKQSLTDAEK